MKRYDCLEVLRNYISEDDLVITSLGGLVDEWYNLRRSDADLPLEILGSITPVALGLAIALPHRKVVCIDTDGSLFLNIGVLCTLGNLRPKNLIVYILDNECYECIGGPPTHTSGNVDLEKMALGAGIESAISVYNLHDFTKTTEKVFNTDEGAFIVCKIETGTVVYPTEKRKLTDGFEDKYRFLRFIERLEGITIKPPSEHN